MKQTSTPYSAQRRLLATIVILFIWGISFSQPSMVMLSGKVIEKKSGQPVPYATISVFEKETKKLLTGTTSNENGEFNLPLRTQNFYVEVSFIGFEKKTIHDITISSGKASLGTIVLGEDSENLDEIVVQGEKSTVEFKLDKRVFNVGSDLSSTGASALEVMNNVPSVNVDIEGNITLRGSGGVQILINGKPSVIASESGNALGTITADMIEKVEVITNPSAKHDAEGTSGIINIVLKKEERKGLNGSISVNTGYPHNHSVGVSLNRRTEKFNLFTQLGAGYRERPIETKNINTDRINHTTVNSNGEEYRNEEFYNVVLGTDYHINERHVVTLSGNFALELEDQPSETNFKIEDSSATIVSQHKRTETTSALNPKYQYELQYKGKFKDNKKHTLLISAMGNFFGKDQESDFVEQTLLGTYPEKNQKTETDFHESKHTLKLDYTKPFSKTVTVETGAQYVLQEVSNDYSVTDQIDGSWVLNEGLTNVFDYNQNVLGLYGTAAFEKNKYGLKLGLRVENTDLHTNLTAFNGVDSSNYKQFTNVFPTVHTSYKITEQFSLQAGYSRRIYRPRLWELNPFFNIRNTYNVRTGNPNLEPEFTDSYEFSTIFIQDKFSMNASLYMRHTDNVIERVSTFENNVTTVHPENVGTNDVVGAEYSMKYRPNKIITIQGDVNYRYGNKQGQFEGTSFDFYSDSWSTKWTAKFDLPKDFDIELTNRYHSSIRTVQGKSSDNYTADFGFRKKMMKGKAVISIGISDIFNTRAHEFEMSEENYYTYSFRRHERMMTLSFSYGFGKGEAMEFSGARRRH